ncbi:hypothetical protein XBKQ1_2640001 [Xenorhabdus bovienii str. kraussei Quebec]|uniref:Uncharacterized protein n=3 Tax=Xenorhabdus bovienii TaxID=40576 RepID=A0A077PIB8_XENBV|nr:hypothetical protein XBFM1_900059 [Xenorhabdus bovienii str. feltiae Moldova]CDH20471.1 hypothetical protein XBKQ1_2640001 [Xenorhabdus bovienii str. kraussei Quebec]CDH22292.1 hypothetical protein XBKB1_1060014 [Xenorhabdus bovienii str. kraussei Becker Underwood]
MHLSTSSPVTGLNSIFILLTRGITNLLPNFFLMVIYVILNLLRY